MASEQILADLDGAIIMGELSLDGGVRHMSGVLPIAHAAQEQGSNYFREGSPKEKGRVFGRRFALELANGDLQPTDDGFHLALPAEIDV